MQRVLSTVTLLGLLLATAAAFAITEHLKLIKSPIYRTQVSKAFSPVCRCATAQAEITFTLRHANRLTVTIKNAARQTVATLATDRREPKGPVTFSWNGRTDTGATVLSGTFQPEVYLARQRRTILLPNRIVVDTTPLKVLSANVGKGVLTPGGTRTIAIHYVLSGRGHAIVYVGGRQVIRGHPSGPSNTVKWNGRVGGRVVGVGKHVLEVGAVDLVGNVTPPSGRQRVTVTIRYLTLSESQIHTRPGVRFSVKVASVSPSYRWRLAGRHGSGSSRKLRLQAPSTRGRYRLVVRANGHSTSTLVIVGGA